MYQSRQSCLLPGRVYLGIPQSPSSLVLALHPRCFWVWDQQKCFKRYPLSIKNSFLALQERKNGYRALFQEKGEKKPGIAISPGGKNDVLKEIYRVCFVQNKACEYVDFISMYANQQIIAYYCWIKVLTQLFFINKTCESDIGVRTCLIREAVMK